MVSSGDAWLQCISSWRALVQYCVKCAILAYASTKMVGEELLATTSVHQGTFARSSVHTHNTNSIFKKYHRNCFIISLFFFCLKKRSLGRRLLKCHMYTQFASKWCLDCDHCYPVCDSQLHYTVNVLTGKTKTQFHTCVSAERYWILIDGTILISYVVVSWYSAVQRINLKQVTVLYAYIKKKVV